LAARNDKDHVVIIDEHRRIGTTFIGATRDAGFRELVMIDFPHFKYSSIMDKEQFGSPENASANPSIIGVSLLPQKIPLDVI
jgi:hypothetical protein